MGQLLERATATHALRRAWNDVLAGDREDGELSVGVQRFADRADHLLAELEAELADGTYEPRPLTEIVMREEDRVLHVPAVRDRIVERSVLDQVTPLVDPHLGPASFAYRPGLGVVDAVQALARLREEGLRWVLRTDVDQCFPSVPVGHARRLLTALVPDAELLILVDRLLGRPSVRPSRGRGLVRGLAQGCALSPLLANLMLTELDDALLDRGFPVVRYADDVSVATASADEAWEAARHASAALEVHGMSLGADKTEVMSFDTGFCFLGEDFGPRYPPVLDEHRVVPPTRRVLYAGLQGGRIGIREGRVMAESSEDVVALDVPCDHISRVVCFGSVGVTAGLRSWALANELDVTFVSRRGTYLGQLLPASASRRIDRLRRQLAFPEASEQVLAVGRAIVDAKVSKQIVVLQRFGRREHADEVRATTAEMRSVLAMLPAASGRDELMGIEGAAASRYFPTLGGLMPEALRFEHRSRQPPLDVANAALSFLYTLLLGEATSALWAAGLDPGIGVLHAEAEKRPSLALDLIEEFRPLIVDQVVLQAARIGELTSASGRTEDGRAGVYLTKAARTSLIAGYERRMLQTTKGALPDFSGSLRRHLYRQAQRLAGAIAHGHAWTGMSWR